MLFQKITFFVFIFLLIAFQVFFLSNFFPNETAPSLIILIIIFLTIKVGFEKTLKVVIFSGIILDIFYFWPIGVNVVSLVIISFATGYLAKRFLVADFFSRVFWVIVIIAVATIINEALVFLIFEALAFLQKTNNIQVVFNLSIWKEILFNIILFSIIFWPIKKITSFLSLYNRKTEQKYYVK